MGVCSGKMSKRLRLSVETDLRLALRPGAVSPAVAGLHQAGLPLLHLGGAGPPVTLGSLDHCSAPPQLAWGAAEKKNKHNHGFILKQTETC